MDRWKVLIVDDEPRIGFLIERLIRWEELCLEKSGIADNGKKALEMILESEPDIVITDIRMPAMNGLELIRVCKAQKKEIRFIVISGYKEFEYARQALQYGVEDYLLKPIDEQILHKTLQKVIEGLENDVSREREREYVRKTLDKSEKIMKENLFNSLMHMKTVPKEEYSRIFRGEVFRSLDIKLDDTDIANRDEDTEKRNLEEIIRITESVFRELTEGILVRPKEYLHIYCIISYEYSKERAVREAIDRLLIEITQHLLGFEQYEATIGIGGQKEEFGEIRYSVAESEFAVNQRIVLGSGKLIYAENFLEKRTGLCYIPSEKDEKELYTIIEVQDAARQNRFLETIFLKTESSLTTEYSLFYGMGEDLISTFFSILEKEDPVLSELSLRLREKIHHCNRLLPFKNILREGLTEALKYYKEIRRAESVKPIRRAKAYIKEHYAEKITLEEMAALVNLNPVYFSVLFKKETGMNFSTYLVETRIQQAKLLIRTGNETIAAIGEMVGYKDYRHFSQVFTRTVGIKPALYRKLHA